MLFRSDVIDIFPAESEKEAVRVELFDDEIEQISFFDPLTGEVAQRVPRTTIYPKTHYVTPRETRVGVGAFIGYDTSYFNQRGQLVARATQGTYSFIRKEDSEIQR